MEISDKKNSVTLEEYQLTKNKNIFEEVIDKMMLESFTPEFSAKIMNMPLKDKRMSILSLLDKDRNLFLRIKGLINSGIGKYEHIKDVILMLREYVKVGEVEKKKFGEVMTPLELVKEMLEKLPEEVWSNPDLKWLDPANGTGPYPLMVIYKLMNGLKSCKGLEDDEIRYKHIVKNMIYVCELQPKNMFLYMCAVDPWDSYHLNIYTGSFLEEGFDKHMKEVWNLDKFDIIMGNPPYNGAETGGGNSLWDKFIRKSMPLLNNNKYLLFVHPSAWRKPISENSRTNDIWKLLSEQNQILYLEIHSVNDGIKTFNAGTRYDFYCVEKTKKYKNTVVIDESGNRVEINCSEWNFLPNYNIEKVKKLLGTGCEVIFSRSLYATDRPGISDTKNDVFKYPLIHSTPKKGVRYKYADRDKGHFGVSKVIFGESGINDVIIDINGEYGITNSSIGIKISNLEDAQELKKFLLSDEFKEVLSGCMWGNFRIDWRLFTYFKKDFWKQ
jgi:hypothetical protein